MKIEYIDQTRIAVLGLETVVKQTCGNGDIVGLACHMGQRRAPTAIKLLYGAGYPVANILIVKPTVNYYDLLNRQFTITDEGLSVPGKTDLSFRHLWVFHDGSDEEEKALRKIRDTMKLEARGVLETIVFARVRDDGDLLSIG